MESLSGGHYAGNGQGTRLLRPIGQHPSFIEVLDHAARLASIARPVLIRGERGTGKELVARYLHGSGCRQCKPFVTVNCGALGGDLLRSELFGHERGAFTGATEARPGKLRQADGGTLFLDEVGNMSMEFQEKILRVVEYQEFESVGGGKSVKVDVRVIAATNAHLEQMIDEGEFRADLHDRLSFAVLQVPPLRERRSDIPLLIQHFARDLATEVPSLDRRRFGKAALDELLGYHWPGNVRELKNVVERILIMNKGEGEEILPSELPPEITALESSGSSFDDRVETFQRAVLLAALKDANLNQKAAAKALSLTYDKFRHFYKKLRIKEYLP